MIEINTSHENLVLYIQKLEIKLQQLEFEIQQLKSESNSDVQNLEGRINTWIQVHNSHHRTAPYYTSNDRV